MNNRDEAAAYTDAYLAEYRSYLAAGLTERAEAVAVELRARGVDIPAPPESKVEAPQVEKTVPPAPHPERQHAEKAAPRKATPAKAAD